MAFVLVGAGQIPGAPVRIVIRRQGFHDLDHAHVDEPSAAGGGSLLSLAGPGVSSHSTLEALGGFTGETAGPQSLSFLCSGVCEVEWGTGWGRVVLLV